MDIDISKFVAQAAPMDYFASVAEIGRNAGPDTWRAACEDAPEWNFLDTDEKRESFREWIRPYGAWEDDEIAAWSDVELNALFIQWVSGDMRECGIEPGCDWGEIEAEQQAGACPSNIYRVEGGTVWFSLEH